MEDFSKMTVANLKSYAEENGIDLGSAKTKTAILSVITGTKASISGTQEENSNNVIGSTTIVKEKRVPVSNARSNEDGVLTVGSADTFKNKEFKKEEKVLDNKVAIFSEKNVHWQGIGGITKGYNIVTKEAAEKWLTRKGIREATPQEVANYYGL
jgi:hypothetical protein